jgi:hypothetical protein
MRERAADQEGTRCGAMSAKSVAAPATVSGESSPTYATDAPHGASGRLESDA